MASRDETTPKQNSFPPCIPIKCDFKERNMKVKINEDWLATIIAFVLLILAMVNVINPTWMKF